jgi:hypothetical protein
MVEGYWRNDPRSKKPDLPPANGPDRTVPKRIYVEPTRKRKGYWRKPPRVSENLLNMDPPIVDDEMTPTYYPGWTKQYLNAPEWLRKFNLAKSLYERGDYEYLGPGDKRLFDPEDDRGSKERYKDEYGWMDDPSRSGDGGRNKDTIAVFSLVDGSRSVVVEFYDPDGYGTGATEEIKRALDEVKRLADEYPRLGKHTRGMKPYGEGDKPAPINVAFMPTYRDQFQRGAQGRNVYGWTHQDSGMIVIDSAFLSPYNSLMTESWQHGLDSGFHPPNVHDGLTGVLRHEWGHLISEDKTREATHHQTVRGEAAPIATPVTGYQGSQIPTALDMDVPSKWWSFDEEGWAEAFSSWVTDPNTAGERVNRIMEELEMAKSGVPMVTVYYTDGTVGQQPMPVELEADLRTLRDMHRIDKKDRIFR